MLTVKIKNPNYVEGGSDKWIPISALTQSVADGIVVNDGDGTKYLADDGVYKEISLDGYATEEWVEEQGYLTEYTDTVYDDTEVKTRLESLESVTSTAVQPDAIADMETKTNASATYATKDELNTHATEAREYTDTVITNLVNAAPDTLDTLGELAQAILDNEDVVELLESSVTNKLDKTEAEQTYATKEDVTITTMMDVPNGVYVVTADGQLVDKSTSDNTAIGVAFISANQKVMIAKADATDGTNNTLYWGKNLYEQDVPNLENLADKTAAKADYNGKANTAAIIAGYAALGKDMDSRDMCKVLETFNEGGYTDWYVPAAGQLYEFYSNKAALSEAFAAISGTAFALTSYWSSSEKSANNAWRVYFDSDIVHNTGKNETSRVRFVRDLTLETKTSLKDKISQIESTIPTKVSQLDNDNNYVYNSNSLINDIQVVSALPESPLSTTLYLITE